MILDTTITLEEGPMVQSEINVYMCIHIADTKLTSTLWLCLYDWLMILYEYVIASDAYWQAKVCLRFVDLILTAQDIIDIGHDHHYVRGSDGSIWDKSIYICIHIADTKLTSTLWLCLYDWLMILYEFVIASDAYCIRSSNTS